MPEYLSQILDQLRGLDPDPVQLGVPVAVVVIVLIFYGRQRRRKLFCTAGSQVVQCLQEQNAVVDVYTGATGDTLACRAVVVKTAAQGLTFETVEDADLRGLKPGAEVSCGFRPVQTAQGKVNAFAADFLRMDQLGRDVVRFTLSPPRDFSLRRRRRHGRKRVVDQQFIRAKLWLNRRAEDADGIMESAPDIAVNSFDPRTGEAGKSQVVNISKGGLAVRVGHADELPDLTVGAALVIHISLFNFRQKLFKPYWYAGEIRSVEMTGPETARLGIEFTRVAGLDEDGAPGHFSPL